MTTMEKTILEETPSLHYQHRIFSFLCFITSKLSLLSVDSSCSRTFTKREATLKMASLLNKRIFRFTPMAAGFVTAVFSTTCAAYREDYWLPKCCSSVGRAFTA